MAIYMGPTLVFVGWWFLLRKLLRIAHGQRITSIADFLSSRFGKSSKLAILVTVIAVVTITPYIALQLKAVTTSIQVISTADGRGRLAGLGDAGLGLAVAMGMAVFTILFGTRNVDARAQHPGVVAAIAFEASVKFVALVAVGLFVVFGLSDGPAQIYPRGRGRVHHPRARPLRQPLGHGAVPVGLRGDLPAAAVPDHRGGKRRRKPPAHRRLGVPGLSAADEPVHPAHRLLRAGDHAGGVEPGHVRADPADGGRPERAGAVCLYRGVFLGHLDDHRGLHRAVDHGVEPYRAAAGAALYPRPGRARGAGHRAAAAGQPAHLDRRDPVPGVHLF